ncbi:MAG: helix-turn-helix domain-containing protein [Bacteroidales bacterium]|nr:helix-turn-helix domain-containing protein [Bacteroidales bacterium]MBP7497356.1 helix-turn-helix domain-containing protein [Bacteroidales bacterium]
MNEPLTILKATELENLIKTAIIEGLQQFTAQSQPQHQEGGDELFTINEVAKLLKVTRQTIDSYMKKGLLKPLRIGSAIRFHKKDIDNFMKQK